MRHIRGPDHILHFGNLHTRKGPANREIMVHESASSNGRVTGRVLARISKMPVQNSNFKISARPDLATNLLQILMPATIYSLVCQQGRFTLQLCPRRRFVRKIFGYHTQKVKIEKSS